MSLARRSFFTVFLLRAEASGSTLNSKGFRGSGSSSMEGRPWRSNSECQTLLASKSDSRRVLLIEAKNKEWKYLTLSIRSPLSFATLCEVVSDCVCSEFSSEATATWRSNFSLPNSLFSHLSLYACGYMCMICSIYFKEIVDRIDCSILLFKSWNSVGLLLSLKKPIHSSSFSKASINSLYL